MRSELNNLNNISSININIYILDNTFLEKNVIYLNLKIWISKLMLILFFTNKIFLI